MAISYQLIRSSRKTLQLMVNAEGELIVRAPLRFPQSEIDDFVRRKQAWIEEKQAIQRQRKEGRPQITELTDGARLPWQGGMLTVRLCDVPLAIDYHGMLLLPADAPQAEARAWLMRRAAELLTPRVQLWAARTGLHPTSLSYGLQRKRWGSMSSAGSMRLNAALLLCPPSYADYVIVHELAHLRHPNHSPAFHELVRSILPNADELRAATRTLPPQVELFAASSDTPAG